jgi:hypothetical protein
MIVPSTFKVGCEARYSLDVHVCSSEEFVRDLVYAVVDKDKDRKEQNARLLGAESKSKSMMIVTMMLVCVPLLNKLSHMRTYIHIYIHIVYHTRTRTHNAHTNTNTYTCIGTVHIRIYTSIYVYAYTSHIYIHHHPHEHTCKLTFQVLSRLANQLLVQTSKRRTRTRGEE